MAILITGASGYIGSKLVQEITKQGEKIHVICRHPTSELQNNPNVKIFTGSITDKKLVKKAIKNCTSIFHLAAQFNMLPLNEMREINVEASKNLFLEALKNNAKVVFTSSAGAIGPQISKNLITERTQRITPFFNHYEQTKSEAEKEALLLFKKGLQIVIVNPTRVYGPGILNQGNFFTIIIEKYCKGIWRFIPGNGFALNNVVYVEDVIKGHLLAMRNGKIGERYILGGENISTNDFFKLLSKITKQEYKMYHISIKMMKGVVKIADYISVLLDKEPIVTPEWIERYTYDWGTDISKAQKELGYHPISLEEGLKRTILWLQEKTLT